MESTLKKRVHAGFIINFVILLFLGGYTINLVKVIHQACRRGSEDAQARNEVELGTIHGSGRRWDQTGSSGRSYNTFHQSGGVRM